MTAQYDLQPNFPNSDISDGTAELLNEFFSSDPNIDFSHANAERLSFIYRVGHPSLERAAKSQLDEVRAAAFSDGIRIFEAIGPMVRTDMGYPDEAAAMRHILAMDERLSDSPNHLINLLDTFKEEQPRVAGVIGAIATRFWRQNAEYAISGAATVRQVELDVSRDIRQFELEFNDNPD